MAYFIMFSVSILFFSIALKFRYSKKKLFYFFSGVALFLPCMMAGMRQIFIGTDVRVYVKPVFDRAKDTFDLISFINKAQNEVGVSDILYLLLNYFVARMGFGLNMSMFLQQLLTIGPIYIALLNDNKKSRGVLIGIFMYYMFWYNASYNMVRQSIALAFEILAVSFLIKNKKKYYLYITIIAILFHSTAILSLIVYLYYNLFSSKRSMKQKISISILSVVVLIISIMIFKPVIDLGIRLHIITGSRAAQVAKFGLGINFSITNTLFYLFIAFLVFKYQNNIETIDLGTITRNSITLNHSCNKNWFKVLSVVSLITLQIGAIISFADRISYYFFYPCVFLALPRIVCQSTKITLKQIVYIFIVLTVFFLYWTWWTIILNYHATLPYVAV